MRLWYPLANYVFGWVLLADASAQAVVKPSPIRLRVRINDQEKELRGGERLELIRGDQLALLQGSLQGKAQGPDLVNFVGFRSEGPRQRNSDDLNVAIDTLSLKRGWSENKLGRLYRIEVSTRGVKDGQIEVSLLHPELQWLRIAVRDQEHRLANGQSLQINAEDPIKVLAVKTNSPEVDEQLRVEFKEQQTASGKQVELQLKYRSHNFASVFLKVKSP